MFTLKFRKSKSRNYPIIQKLACKFSNYTLMDNINTIDLSVKEIFEKWDFFNLLFWKTVDWQGSTFGYNNYNLHSHSDKTRIFYALQDAHSKWICMYVDIIKDIDLNCHSPEYLKNLEANSEYIDRILDKITIAKYKEEYNMEFGYLNFETPISNSDFVRRRLKREERKNNNSTQE